MPRVASPGYLASDGAAYERFLGRWTERLAIAEFADLAVDGAALDVGCGTGALAVELARREPERRVIGVDVSKPYLDYARGHRQAANLHFQHADAARLFSHPLAAPDGLQQLWSAAGIVDIAGASLTIRMDYKNFDDYWDPLLGGQGPVGAYVASLDADLRARLRERVRAAYLSGRADGIRSLAATAWAVRRIVPDLRQQTLPLG